MKILDKYLFGVVDQDYEKKDQLHIETVKRIKNYARLIHIPVLVWLILGAGISHYEFGLEIPISLMIGAFCAIIIYFIDLAIISTPQNRWANLGRFCIGFLLAFVTSFFIDAKIFEKDIFKSISKGEISQSQSEIGIQIDQKRIEVTDAKDKWQIAQKNAECELDGSCGSAKIIDNKIQDLSNEKAAIISLYKSKRAEVLQNHKNDSNGCGLFCSQEAIDKKRDLALDNVNKDEKNQVTIINNQISNLNLQSTAANSPRGAGKVYKEKLKYANELKSIYMAKANKLKVLEQDYTNAPNNIASNVMVETGLLMKAKAMKDIILNDIFAMGIWLVFSLLFLFLELMLVIVKLASPETIDDMKENLQILKAKAQYRLVKNDIEDFESNSKKYEQDKGSYRAITQGTVG